MKSVLAALLASTALWSAVPSQAIGLQLWSLRNDLQADVAHGMAEVKAFGIVYVEPHSTYGLTPTEFRKQMDAAGLKATAAHFPYERFSKDLDGVIADAKIFGVSYVVLPWLPVDTFTVDVAHKLAADFNAWGPKLNAAGLKLAYHPHGFEFVPAEGGGTAFDVLMLEAKPENVCFELDVFWAAHAGADPVALLKKYPTRFKLLHIKDMRKGATITPGKRSAPAEDNVAMGLGELDLKSLLKVSETIGIEYYFIEDETEVPQRNIPIGVSYLKAFKP
jgi:sugar phosphate isomerase/epimerase